MIDNATVGEEALSLTPLAIVTVVGYCSLIGVTVSGNLLVILAFAKEPTLRAITNYWIVSLSLTDICLACTVLPLQLARELNYGLWYYGETWCDVFICLDVLCCTCSIYHLALISLDRYLCVRFPIAYPSLRTSPRTIWAISLTWVWCAILAMPRLFGWKDAFVPNDCEMRNKSYMLFSSLVSFYIPLFLIMCMYVGIYRATQARAHRFRRELLASQRVAAAHMSRKNRADSAPTLPIARVISHTPFSSSSKSFSSNTASPGRRTTAELDLETIPEATVTGPNNSDESRSTVTRLNPHDMELLTPEGLLIDDPETSGSFTRNKISLLRNVRHVGRRLATFRPPFLVRSQTADWLSPPTEAECRSRRYSSPACDDSDVCSMLHSEPNLRSAHRSKLVLGDGTNGDSEMAASTSASVTTGTTTTGTNLRSFSRAASSVQRTASDIHRRQRKLTQAKLKRRRQKQENRTARVVLIVLGAFVIFWAPFFVLNVVLPWCGETCLGQQAQAVVWRWAVFWGYINSAINPFIYTFFNRTFRRAISSVLKCRRGRQQ
uniref:G-protein coupled receptors family 1 profile domain-containing protein n=1 Tax=Plectus sambesii TaxID=2011161 RepID=A0A914VZ02_9BILA